MESPSTEDVPGTKAIVQSGIPMHQSMDTQDSLAISGAELGRGRVTGQSPRALSQLRGGPVRAGSTPGSARSHLSTSLSAVKAAADNANVLALRKQMTDSEDKIRQLSRAQQQMDRLRDATQQRIDQKMSTMEAMQPKLDRRLAELGGNYKGLSDEMQTQIRRIDAMDAKLWDWKHQLDDDVRGKIQEMQEMCQKLSSEVRVSRTTTDEALKRLTQRVGNLDKDFVVERMRESLEEAHARIEELEKIAFISQHEVVPAAEPVRAQVPDIVDAEHLAKLVSLENRMRDISTQIETVTVDYTEVHGRVEAQEERLKTMRTLFDTKEEHYRWLKDKVEGADYEGKMKEVQSQMASVNQTRAEDHEFSILLQKKLEALEQSYEEVKEQVVRAAAAHQVMEVPRHDEFAVSSSLLEVKDCALKVEELEKKLDLMGTEMGCMRSDSELGPRIAALIEQLQEIAPKITEHDEAMREMSTKVGRIETDIKFDKNAGLSESLKARVGRLEVEVETLKEAAEDNGIIPIGQGGSPEDEDEGTENNDSAGIERFSPRRSRRVSATE